MHVRMWLSFRLVLVLATAGYVSGDSASLLATTPTVASPTDRAKIETNIVKPGSIYKTAEFATPYSNGTFRHLAVSEETHDVFIGAVDYLYSLDENLNRKQEVKTGPAMDSGKCPPPVDEVRNCPFDQSTNNVNKVLVIDEVNDRLIACGTLYHGYCEKRDLANIAKLEPPDYKNSVVSNNATVSTVAFIAPGPATENNEDQRVLYVSVSWSNPDVSLDDVPALSSRRLSDFKVAFNDVLKFTSTSFSFEGQSRPQFPVRYIYGFSSENFSYMLAVQKKEPGQEIVAYQSVILRVCQNDINYYTYVEVPLLCSFGSTTNASFILVAAHLAKAGRKLALSLGINTKVDVLFTLFAVVDNQSGEYKAEALCVFMMDDIRKKFTETIVRCFSGIGLSGGGHLGVSKECNKYSYQIGDDYCGEFDSNSPIGGTLPMETQPILVFPPSSSRLSAIRVTTTPDYTVAFVGTKDGKIMKVSVESNRTSNIYETLSVVENQSIESDMSFDDDKEHIYVLTEKKVVKLKVQNCSQYLTCSECLGAKDPYCGWCSLEDKCSQKKECQGSEQPKRWLPYDSQECPRIKKIIPNQIQKDRERLLTLDIQHIPDIQIITTYKCVFTSISNPNMQEVVTMANRTSSSLQCYTPATHLLPPFQHGSDHVSMKLFVLMSDRELVHETVTFFDCGIHTSCTACTMSQFSCTWCVRKHMCTDNTDQHCNTDVLITGINRSGISTTPGPKHCPKIESVQGGNEILVAEGSYKGIQVKATSLQEFQFEKLRCQFSKVREVAATIEIQPDDSYMITCQETEFTYPRDAEFQNVSLKILWGGGDNPLDNPNGILVVVYKCRSMAQTCGGCLTVDPKYICGWCNDATCMAENFCQSGDFLQKGAVCPNPQIYSFSPKSGPTQGGTFLTILGKNLGSIIDEVQVSIDRVKCNVTELKAHEKIVCKTEPTSFVWKDKVKVIIGHGTGNQFMTESHDQFQFVKPTIMDIFPSMGPFSGGTIVTMQGEHLDAGSNVSIIIGYRYPCTQPYRANASTISCKTSAVAQPQRQILDVSVNIDDELLQTKHVAFTYVEDPNVTWVSRNMFIRSGGLQMNVSGENLHHVQSPQMIIWANDRSYFGPCTFSETPATNITCMSPMIPDLRQQFDGFRELDFGFKMDDVQHLQRLSSLGKIRMYPDPELEKYKDGEKVHQQTHEILFINGHNLTPLKHYDVRVHIGRELCMVTSVISTVITCKPPPTQPAPVVGSGLPEVVVHIGQNLTFSLGLLRYEKPEELSQAAIIGIAVSVPLLAVITCIVLIICLIKSRRNDDMMKKMRKDMDQLESRVANECKEAFAELQTDMNVLTNNLSGGSSIPFWDYRTYCMRVLFPPECNDHPVIRELELDYRHREDTERGLKLFFNLIRNKTFLLVFIRTLEANKDFSLKERVNVASLISVSLQTQMEYSTEILKTLLAELIEKTVENPKGNPKILLRRNESVAEKMLTNWFTFLLYKFLKECAGEPLFMLFGAIKQQISNGPVDAMTSEARYSLSEDKLIRQQIIYTHLWLNVMDLDMDRCSQRCHQVKVLDCDTISQVKEKILDALYMSASFSSRPPKEELDLVLFDHSSEWVAGDRSQLPLRLIPNRDTKHLVLSDFDHTTKSEGDYKPLNTLSHYKVPDGAFVALRPKQTSIFNMNILSEKSKCNENMYYSRSPYLNRTINPSYVHNEVDGCKVYHLVRHYDFEHSNKEGDRSNKMVSEIYLPRLLVTKGTLQVFVDDLFEHIFSTAHRGTALPLAIKYMFDFLDDQALHHSMGDEVVHIWKSNSLPLRFWVNVIKNPNFAFDIYKSNIVDACLTVIGQTFIDSCSTNENKLTKDSPSGKLLYAKDIPKYKQWVARYYQDIKIMPAISDQDMTAMLAEESRIHQNEFNTNAALLELYKYVRRHYDDIMNALEDDEFAKKSRLTYKLDQVALAMDGAAVC